MFCETGRNTFAAFYFLLYNINITLDMYCILEIIARGSVRPLMFSQTNIYYYNYLII